MTDQPRWTAYVPVDDLPDAPSNAKDHAGEVIENSIRRFRFVEPPLLDERTGLLVGGHGRRDALQRMRAAGEPAPEGVMVGDDGAWLAPVGRGWASTDDAEAEAVGLALNRTGEIGGWKDQELAESLARHAALPDGLVGLGFDQAYLDDLLARITPEPERHSDPDDVPEVPSEPITQVGDVWQLGVHRLICGDCTKPEVVALLLDGVSPELVLTDPPYCSGGFNETGKAAGSVGTTATHKQVANDRLSTRGYIALLKSALGQTPNAYAYVFTDWRMWTYLFDVVESSGFGVRSMIVWDKGTPGMGRGWRAQHELIMWAAKAVPPFDKHMSGVGNVLASKRTGNVLHTTQKPVDLLERLIAITDGFAHYVYDPFAGSGSTLIASETQGRTFYGCELDAAYADVVCARYQQFTGIKPTRNGEPVDFL